ncbi:selenocysteine lyase [Haematobacter missouriensis]|uniref:septum site-determining protein MinC n=1 Tax=Haematobacter missouriensis TaxID=366616 RepID=UPI0004E8B2A5|nr:septum site-determining protein MinC [Haematobacter missouriensis]KFI24614.1 selenocysteine lyase [Haematobacter missouriensis]
MSDQNVRTRHDPAPAEGAAFQVRGRFLTALALRIGTDRADGPFYAQLDEQLQQTPQFFLGAPVVLDFVNTASFADLAALRELVENLRARELRVFGVQNAPGMDPAALQSLGLIVLNSGKEVPLPRDAMPAQTTGAQAADPQRVDAPPPVVNKVIRSPIRSGQLIVAEHGDLTIIGSVASGAELVAAGNIHVYGALRGRAMAGCHGNTDAHIFCQTLDAELVAIAGLYQTNEGLEDAARQRCAHIYLKQEKLFMEVVG